MHGPTSATSSSSRTGDATSGPRSTIPTGSCTRSATYRRCREPKPLGPRRPPRSTARPSVTGPWPERRAGTRGCPKRRCTRSNSYSDPTIRCPTCRVSTTAVATASRPCSSTSSSASTASAGSRRRTCSSCTSARSTGARGRSDCTSTSSRRGAPPACCRYVAAGELGSGVFFNPVVPEELADRLRAATRPNPPTGGHLMPNRLLTDDEVDRYHRDGYVPLGRILDDADIDELLVEEASLPAGGGLRVDDAVRDDAAVRHVRAHPARVHERAPHSRWSRNSWARTCASPTPSS